MADKRHEGDGSPGSGVDFTRRDILAASGVLTTVGLAGCSTGNSDTSDDSGDNGDNDDDSGDNSAENETSEQSDSGDSASLCQPPMGHCLGTVTPVATDADGSCSTADGESVPATGEGAANWFGVGNCNTTKEYEVESGTEHRIVVYGAGCSLAGASLRIEEQSGSGWETAKRLPERQPSFSSRADQTVVQHTPESDRLRVVAEGVDDEDTEVYVSVYERPRWSEGNATSLGTEVHEGYENEVNEPAGIRTKEGFDTGDATWEYDGVASQGVTWTRAYESDDRIVYRLGITGQLVTRRAEVPGEDGELALQYPDEEAHPASDAEAPVELPTTTIERQGYVVETPGGARVEEYSDAYSTDRSTWRYGEELSQTQPEREKSLTEVVGRAFAPKVTPQSLAKTAAEKGVTWAAKKLFSETAKQGVKRGIQGLNYAIAFTDLWTSIAMTCNNWERNDRTDDRLARVTSVCKGSGGASHFAQVDVSVPKGESATITVTNEFLATKPFRDGSATVTRELTLNPDGEEELRATPASDDRVPCTGGGSGWRQKGFDAANTSHAVGESGPTEGVSVKWFEEQPFADHAVDGRDVPLTASDQSVEPVVMNDKIYVGTNAGIRVLSARTGNVAWERRLDGPVPQTTPVYDGTVYAATAPDDGTSKLYTLNAETGDGEVLLELDDGEVFTTAPVLADNTLYYGVAPDDPDNESVDPQLHAVGPETGDELWATTLAGEPFLPSIGDLVYVTTSSRDEAVLALNPNDGEKLWTVSDLDEQDWASAPREPAGAPPTLHEDTLYVQGRDAGLYAYDVNTTNRQWSIVGSFDFASAAIAHGNLYVHSDSAGGPDGSLRVVDAETGRVKWGFDTKAPDTSPVVADGTLYFYATTAAAGYTTEDGVVEKQYPKVPVVYAYDAESPRKLWEYKLTQEYDEGVGDSFYFWHKMGTTVVDGDIYVGNMIALTEDS
jgi:hypothetical protein